MNKAVMISIRPKWCELIVKREKTIEVRKSCPKLKPPFKCYIYQTLPKSGDWNERDGRVIGEFVCDEVHKFSTRVYLGGEQKISDEEIVKKSRVSRQELRSYEGRRQGIFGWLISNLTIYDKPKKISEFKRWNRTEENAPCTHVPALYEPCETCKECNLTRPPQSWCYVEALDADEGGENDG